MLTRGPLLHPRYPSGYLKYNTLPRNQQIYLGVLKGILALVFNPPPTTPSPSSLTSSSSPPPTPVFQTPSDASLALNGYPETLYLDSTRLALLSSEAADVTAICMFLLLYRQLIFSESNEARSYPPRVLDANLIQLKREIRDLGPPRLGHCFSPQPPSDVSESLHESRPDRKEAERWLAAKQDIVLQIAKRAKETRIHRHTIRPSQPPSPAGEASNDHMTSLAQRWADYNMHPNSTLAVMLRRRLHDIVFNTVVKLAYPGPDSSTARRSTVDFLASARADSVIEMPLGAATGMEPLTDEIRTLSEKISRLALIHLNAFLPLYEQEGFLELP